MDGCQLLFYFFSNRGEEFQGLVFLKVRFFPKVMGSMMITETQGIAEDFCMKKVKRHLSYFFERLSEGLWVLFYGNEEVTEMPILESGITDPEILWFDLGRIPVCDDGYIQEPFRHFETGTHREDIWHWIEAEFDVSVHDLMYRS